MPGVITGSWPELHVPDRDRIELVMSPISRVFFGFHQVQQTCTTYQSIAWVMQDLSCLNCIVFFSGGPRLIPSGSQSLEVSSQDLKSISRRSACLTETGIAVMPRLDPESILPSHSQSIIDSVRLR